MASLIEDTDSVLPEPNGDLKFLDKKLKIGSLNRNSSMNVPASESGNLIV